MRRLWLRWRCSRNATLAAWGGYTDYLDALRSLLNVESTLAGGQRDLALARLAVHRALGGEWTEPPESLEGPRMVPADGTETSSGGLRESNE